MLSLSALDEGVNLKRTLCVRRYGRRTPPTLVRSVGDAATSVYQERF
jgi:hypothetical protein